MEKKKENKFLFFLPPIILTAVTLIWYFAEEGRWYTYRDEWAFTPLLVCHLLMPLYYFIRLIIAIIKQINVNTRSSTNVFHIVASIIMGFLCGIGILIFMIFTSGM